MRRWNSVFKVKNRPASLYKALNTSLAALSAVFGGDNVVLNKALATAVFSSPNVGNNIPVNVSGFALTGAQVCAQGWKPEKNIEIVIGLTAGSSQDRTGRESCSRRIANASGGYECAHHHGN